MIDEKKLKERVEKERRLACRAMITPEVLKIIVMCRTVVPPIGFVKIRDIVEEFTQVKTSETTIKDHWRKYQLARKG